VILWIGAAFAADPLLSELPPGADVEIVRGPTSWTVRVGDQTVQIPPATTPEGEAAVRALVASLMSSLDLSVDVPLPEIPAPVPRPRPAPPPPEPEPVVVVAPPPPPPPPPEPEPEPLVRVWAATDLVLRPEVQLGLGFVAGVSTGERAGFDVSLGYRLPRAASGAILTELDLGAGLWGAVRPWLVVTVGGSAVLRWYSAEAEPVTSHVMPRAQLGVGVPVGFGQTTLTMSAAVEADLGVTWIAPAGERYERLSPVAARIQLRAAFGVPR
jgi:hypothetical protein